MKITFICVGKTDNKNLIELINVYEKRLQHYVSFQTVYINELKNAHSLSTAQIKEKEGTLILEQVKGMDAIILLDEKGKQFTSMEFSQHIQKQLNSGIKQVGFVIGGAFGFSDAVYNAAHEKISLSKMTFSHQMIRLFFVEQVYRAFTILKGEKYHHE